MQRHPDLRAALTGLLGPLVWFELLPPAEPLPEQPALLPPAPTLPIVVATPKPKRRQKVPVPRPPAPSGWQHYANKGVSAEAVLPLLPLELEDDFEDDFAVLVPELPPWRSAPYLGAERRQSGATTHHLLRPSQRAVCGSGKAMTGSRF